MKVHKNAYLSPPYRVVIIIKCSLILIYFVLAFHSNIQLRCLIVNYEMRYSSDYGIRPTAKNTHLKVMPMSIREINMCMQDRSWVEVFREVQSSED